MDTFQIAFVGILGTLLGVFLTSVFSLINTRLVQKFENQKHRRDIATKIGLEYWKSQLDLAKYVNSKFGQPTSIGPPDAHIIHMIKLMDMFESEKLNQANLEEKLSELASFTHEMDDLIRAIDSNRKLKKRTAPS